MYILHIEYYILNIVETCSQVAGEKNMKHLLGSTGTISQFLRHVEVHLNTCSAYRKSPGLNVRSVPKPLVL